MIFKENFNVKGLTTAAVIWISAAIGMVIGVQEYQLGFILSFIVLVVLIGFARMEYFIDVINHRRTYRITFTDDNLENISMINEMIENEQLKSHIRHLSKSNNKLMVNVDIRGNKNHFKALTEKLVATPVILGIEH